MAAFDWGTDFGGSIRIPAAFCGVTGLRLSSEPWPVNEQHFPRLSPHFWPWVGMGPIAPTPADCRVVLAALAGLRRPFPVVKMRSDEVALYAPDRACTGKWPTFVADAAGALSAAGLRFEVDRTIPPPAKANQIYNGYVSSHFDEFSATGEIEFREGLVAVTLGLASLGRLDKRVHPTSGAILALDGARPGDHLPQRACAGSASSPTCALRVRRVWDSGRLLVAPTTTSLPPRHGRAILDWSRPGVHEARQPDRLDRPSPCRSAASTARPCPAAFRSWGRPAANSRCSTSPSASSRAATEGHFSLVAAHS